MASWTSLSRDLPQKLRPPGLLLLDCIRSPEKKRMESTSALDDDDCVDLKRDPVSLYDYLIR
jgi:hypothetical protein